MHCSCYILNKLTVKFSIDCEFISITVHVTVSMCFHVYTSSRDNAVQCTVCSPSITVIILHNSASSMHMNMFGVCVIITNYVMLKTI